MQFLAIFYPFLLASLEIMAAEILPHLAIKAVLPNLPIKARNPHRLTSAKMMAPNNLLVDRGLCCQGI